MKPTSENKEWLVYQVLLVSEEKTGDIMNLTNNIQLITVIRRVIALTKEEAIGKFFVETSKMKFKQRIEPIDCFEIHQLSTIQ